MLIKSTIIIRKAILSDAKSIQELINRYSKDGIMLTRSLQYIYEHLRDFFVAEVDKKIVGACGFSISHATLAEVKSLTVSEDFHKMGIATKLLNTGLVDLKKIGIKEVFCLSYVPEFFQKHGFTITEKEKLPHKIWTECINCPSFPNCDETALIKNL